MAIEVIPTSFQRMFKATFLIQYHLKKMDSFLFRFNKDFTIVTQICFYLRKKTKPDRLGFGSGLIQLQGTLKS